MKTDKTKQNTQYYIDGPTSIKEVMSSIKEVMFPNFSEGIQNLDKNVCQGYVEVYLEKSTGKLKLGEPYMSEKDRPQHVERDICNYTYLGTANIQFVLPFKKLPKFNEGDKALLYGYVPIKILKVDIEKEEYTVTVDEYEYEMDKFYKTLGYTFGSQHKITFLLNGQMTKRK